MCSLKGQAALFLGTASGFLYLNLFLFLFLVLVFILVVILIILIKILLLTLVVLAINSSKTWRSMRELLQVLGQPQKPSSHQFGQDNSCCNANVQRIDARGRAAQGGDLNKCITLIHDLFAKSVTLTAHDQQGWLVDTRLGPGVKGSVTFRSVSDVCAYNVPSVLLRSLNTGAEAIRKLRGDG